VNELKMVTKHQQQQSPPDPMQLYQQQMMLASLLHQQSQASMYPGAGSIANYVAPTGQAYTQYEPAVPLDPMRALMQQFDVTGRQPLSVIAAAPEKQPPNPVAAAGGFGDMFRPVVGSWECRACMLRNEANVNRSVCHSVPVITLQLCGV
jgi:hypothetical protein